MRLILAILIALVLAAPARAEIRWSAPGVAATGALATSDLQLDANARGEAVISYLRREGPQGFSGSLDVVRRGAGGKLSRPQTLTRAMWHAWNVAVGADGRAYAVWLDETDDEDTDVAMTIMFAEAAPGQPFGPPRVLAGLFGEWPTSIHVAETAGQLVVAFPYQDSMRVLTRTPGQDFVAHELAQPWGHGALGANARGDAVVAWYRPREGVFGVPFRDGRPGAVQKLANAPRKVGHLRVGVAAGGSVLATWHETYDEDAEADRYYGGITGAAARLGAPGRTFDVFRAPESTRSGPQRPELAVAGDGSGVAAWHHVTRPENVRYATRGRVLAARLSASGRRGKPQPLSSAKAISTEPRVAIDGRGRTAVVWQQVPRDSLERPVRLMASSLGAPRGVVKPAERARAHALAAHARGFLLAYVKHRGTNRGTIALRTGR